MFKRSFRHVQSRVDSCSLFVHGGVVLYFPITNVFFHRERCQLSVLCIHSFLLVQRHVDAHHRGTSRRGVLDPCGVVFCFVSQEHGLTVSELEQRWRDMTRPDPVDRESGLSAVERYQMHMADAHRHWKVAMRLRRRGVNTQNPECDASVSFPGPVYFWVLSKIPRPFKTLPVCMKRCCRPSRCVSR